MKLTLSSIKLLIRMEIASKEWIISKSIRFIYNYLNSANHENGLRSLKGLAYHQVTQESCDEDGKQVENAGLMDFFRTPRMRMRTLNLFYQVISLYNSSYKDVGDKCMLVTRECW